MDDPAVEIDRLTHRYGRRVGVQSLSLRIGRGSIYGFLGPNGAGKTTTIRILLGLLRPSEGAARVFGMDCWRRGPKVRRDVGYLPGDLRLYPSLRGGDLVRIFGQVRRCALGESAIRLSELFDLDLSVRVRKMSRGMRQKLGLVLALAHAPRLVVLDEPSSGLDPLMQERLEEHLRELARAGHTVFFSSHTLSEVERLCDRVAIVRQGRIVADDALDALRERSRRGVVIRWREGQAPDAAPACLDIDLRTADRWEATLTGSSQELIAWLAGKPVADVSIGTPDLEQVFRRFYRVDGRAGAAPGTGGRSGGDAEGSGV